MSRSDSAHRTNAGPRTQAQVGVPEVRGGRICGHQRGLWRGRQAEEIQARSVDRARPRRVPQQHQPRAQVRAAHAPDAVPGGQAAAYCQARRADRHAWRPARVQPGPAPVEQLRAAAVPPQRWQQHALFTAGLQFERAGILRAVLPHGVLALCAEP